jgi:hypothetical protein
MERKLEVAVYLGCCGYVVNYLEPGEESWDYSEREMKRCTNCGKADFPDAFLKMDLLNEHLECEYCKKETKHELYSYDSWNGSGKTKCTECEKINEHI